MTRVLVDSDSLVYAAGFASQAVVYDYSFVKDGEIVDEGITADKSYLGFLETERPMGVEFSYTSIIEAQPLVNALAMVKKILLSIEEAVAAEEIEFKRLELFLTGSGSHRDKIATLRGYKSNRIGVDKPVHYAAIRRYLTERWKAQAVDGMEADDMLAIVAHQEGYDPQKVIIVSMDKDLATVEGKLFNFKRRKWYYYTKEAALINFFRQVLTGDTVDAIPGVYKAGPKKAAELVHEGMTEQAMYDACVEECAASLARKGCPYTHMTAEAVVLEMGQLLHMSRWPGDIWQPPHKRSGQQLGLLS